MNVPRTPQQAGAEERIALRTRAAANYNRRPTTEHIHWNQHHLHYGYTNANGVYRVFDAAILEMNDAQFERLIERTRAARAALRALEE